jgi:hypothetical protein
MVDINVSQARNVHTHFCDYCGGWEEVLQPGGIPIDGYDMSFLVGGERICGICVKCLKKVFDSALGQPDFKESV